MSVPVCNSATEPHCLCVCVVVSLHTVYFACVRVGMCQCVPLCVCECVCANMRLCLFAKVCVHGKFCLCIAVCVGMGGIERVPAHAMWQGGWQPVSMCVREQPRLREMHPHRINCATVTGRHSGCQCDTAASTNFPALPPQRRYGCCCALWLVLRATTAMARCGAPCPPRCRGALNNSYPPEFKLTATSAACVVERVDLRSSAAAFIFERVHLRSSAAAPVWGTWPAVRALGLCSNLVNDEYCTRTRTTPWDFSPPSALRYLHDYCTVFKRIRN